MKTFYQATAALLAASMCGIFAACSQDANGCGNPAPAPTGSNATPAPTCGTGTVLNTATNSCVPLQAAPTH